MIIAEDLGKHFNGFIAVDSVSLRLNAGEVLALLGPNGAGKTTTVRMLSSVLRPTHGWAQVAGFDVVSQAVQVRAVVGVLTEQHGLYGRMPADEYLDFFGQLYKMNTRHRQERSHQLLEDFGLLPDCKRRIGEYSKGMRQKLALARAMLHEPPVLLLDEPSSAMDPESARLVRDAIRGLRSTNRTIVICTHNLSEAEELADQIAIIRKGRIIALGTPANLKRELLGPEEYEVRFELAPERETLRLPDFIQVTSRGPGWIRYTTDEPQETNPAFLKALLGDNVAVTGLKEVPRSLEQVYLQAINVPNVQEAWDVG